MVPFVPRYDIEPFKEGIFPLGEIPFLLFYLRIRRPLGSPLKSVKIFGEWYSVHKYAYANPLNSFFVLGNPYYASYSKIFPRPLKPLFCLCLSLTAIKKLRFLTNTASTYYNRKIHRRQALCCLVLLGLLLFQGLYS